MITKEMYRDMIKGEMNWGGLKPPSKKLLNVMARASKDRLIKMYEILAQSAQEDSDEWHKVDRRKVSTKQP